MGDSRHYSVQPATSRRRGLPAIGFSIDAPDSLQVTLLDPGAAGPLLRGVQTAPDGRVVGEAEIDVFTAALVIDPDRAIRRAAADAADRVLHGTQHRRRHPVSYIRDDGTHACRIEAMVLPGRDGQRPDLPHVTVVATAPDDAACRGGLLVVTRSARPTWEPGDVLITSLHLMTRGSANDNASSRLPLVR